MFLHFFNFLFFYYLVSVLWCHRGLFQFFSVEVIIWKLYLISCFCEYFLSLFVKTILLHGLMQEKYRGYHPRLPIVVAETLLASDPQIELPLWLVKMFKVSSCWTQIFMWVLCRLIEYGWVVVLKGNVLENINWGYMAISFISYLQNREMTGQFLLISWYVHSDIS